MFPLCDYIAVTWAITLRFNILPLWPSLGFIGSKVIGESEFFTLTQYYASCHRYLFQRKIQFSWQIPVRRYLKLVQYIRTVMTGRVNKYMWLIRWSEETNLEWLPYITFFHVSPISLAGVVGGEDILIWIIKIFSYIRVSNLACASQWETEI